MISRRARRAACWPIALTGVVLLLAGCGGGDDDASDRAVTTAGATTEAAQDQAPPATVKARVAVTPDAAGTEEAPRGVSVDLAVDVKYPDEEIAAPMRQVDITLPPGMRFNGDALPKGTRTGSGEATAAITGSAVPAAITVRNGGPDRLDLDLVVTNPARVEATVAGQVSDVDGGGQRIRLAIPKELQEMVGVPVVIRRLAMKAGKDSWLTTTSCPSEGKWTYRVGVAFADDSTIDTTATASCR